MKKSELKKLIREIVSQLDANKQLSLRATSNKNIKCKSCGKSFTPSHGEFSRCPSCINKQHSAGERATGVQEVVETDDPLYVEYIKDMPGEDPFTLGGQKFQYVQAKYPNGKIDIGVYAYAGDVVYAYNAFRQMRNLNESVSVDYAGDPIGYKFLGYTNSGITIPKSDDWQRFYVSPNGNTEKFLSQKLKVWYEVDSSG